MTRCNCKRNMQIRDVDNNAHQVKLICGLNKGHEDWHYDEAFSKEWPRRIIGKEK